MLSYYAWFKESQKDTFDLCVCVSSIPCFVKFPCFLSVRSNPSCPFYLQLVIICLTIWTLAIKITKNNIYINIYNPYKHQSCGYIVIKVVILISKNMHACVLVCIFGDNGLQVNEMMDIHWVSEDWKERFIGKRCQQVIGSLSRMKWIKEQIQFPLSAWWFIRITHPICSNLATTRFPNAP